MFVSNPPRRAPVRFTGRTAGLFVVLALGAVAPAPAQIPGRDACDLADSGERIKCKFENIIEQQRGVAGKLEPLDTLPEIDRQALVKQVERAARAQGRAAAVDFKQLTRKSQVTCQIQEIVGDGVGDDDGICAPNEDCAEVIGDQIGDDDGVCQPRQGHNREICVEICDADAVNADPTNFDDDPAADSRGRDIEEALDVLTDQYEGINAMLDQEQAALAAPRAFALAGGACNAVFRRRASDTLKAALGGGADGARIAADIGERFCDQTAFGVNTAAVCAVVEGIAGTARLVANAVEFGDDNIDSTTIDSIWACLQETSAATSAAVGAVGDVSDSLAGVSLQIGFARQEVGVVDQRVGLLDQKVVALAEQLVMVRAMLTEVTTLLNTPQGQREGFPE